MNGERTKPSYDELEAALERANARLARLDAAARHLSPGIAHGEALRRAILESSTEYAIISLDADGLVTSWGFVA